MPTYLTPTKTPIPPHTGEDVEQQEQSVIVGGNTKLEDSLAASYKAKSSFTIWFKNHTSIIYPNELKKSPQKSLTMDFWPSEK